MVIFYYKVINIIIIKILGDWGLGIGDWAQSPIPNPQSPLINKSNLIYSPNIYYVKIIKNYFK